MKKDPLNQNERILFVAPENQNRQNRGPPEIITKKPLLEPSDYKIEWIENWDLASLLLWKNSGIGFTLGDKSGLTHWEFKHNQIGSI